MTPALALHANVDVLKFSPLLRGMVLAVWYADEHGGIGLTKSDAMNRKFVHWAADHFDWPGYTAAELFEMNKVLNEIDMPPLWPVHDLLRHLKVMRRYKGTLRATKKGRELAERPADFFDLVAPIYLFDCVHDDRVSAEDGLMGNWDIFLNVINVETRAGCTVEHLIKALYGREETEKYDPSYMETYFALKYSVIQPLCWLGLLWEDRAGLKLLEDGALYKTPLWTASLKLESDGQAKLRLV